MASVSTYGSFQVGVDDLGWRVALGWGFGRGAEMMDAYCGGSAVAMVDIDGAGGEGRDDVVVVLLVVL